MHHAQQLAPWPTANSDSSKSLMALATEPKTAAYFGRTARRHEPGESGATVALSQSLRGRYPDAAG